jgi:hypothetical protein
MDSIANAIRSHRKDQCLGQGKIQAGMNFTNMRNELYDDNEDDDSNSDDESDTDSEYNSDDSSSDDDDADDDYDDFIAGVDMENPGNSNPDIEEADENNNDGLSAGQGDDDALDDVSLSEEIANKDVPTSLKKLSDDTGALRPIIQSRTRQQEKETGESLMMGAEAIKTVKKKRKFRKELQIRPLKTEEEENKKKLRNKLRNENKQIRIKKEKGIPPDSAAPPLMETGNEDNKLNGIGDLRDRLRSRQKPGVSFPCDSYSTKELPPDLEAFAMTQYNLKQGLRKFGKDGIVALGKEMEQLHTRKVAKSDVHIKKTMWENQGTRLRGWKKAMGDENQGGGILPHSHN